MRSFQSLRQEVCRGTWKENKKINVDGPTVIHNNSSDIRGDVNTPFRMTFTIRLISV